MKFFSAVFFISLVYITAFGCQASDKLEQFKQLVASQQGKVIYLDFWASWCVPCRKSFPWLNEIQAKYADNNFTVLSVNLDADKKFATDFLAQTQAQFAIFYDPRGQVAKAFKLKGMPSSFIINRQGEVVSRHVGFNEQKQQQYEKEILSLLSAP